MSRIHILLLAPLFVILLAGLSVGAETASNKNATKESAKTAPPKKKTTKAKKPKVQKFVGNISALDTKSGAVSVKGASAEKNFVTQDAAKDAVERLTVGDRVRVQYSEKDGKLMATSVRRVKLPQTKTKATEESTKKKTTKAPSQKNQTKEAGK